MSAGRELDELVSRHVFGTEPCTCGPIGGYDPQTGICSRCGVPPSAHYSTEIAEAWPLAEKFRFAVVPNGSYDGWFAGNLGLRMTPSAPTAAEAICLAALLAVGAELPA